jgi:hypothetical protein
LWCSRDYKIDKVTPALAPCAAWGRRATKARDEIRKEQKEMAKKTRRTTSVSMSSSSARTEFNPDYSIIKRDLGRIGILAGSFFALLVVLSFFIK